MDDKKARYKQEALMNKLKGYSSLLVAFSGGVDSTYLLYLARQMLGERVVAATADSVTFPSRERREAGNFTREKGIPHIIFKSEEFQVPEFIANSPDRCYYCKRSLCESLLKIAAERDIKTIAHAANLDDLDDYRPGLKAAMEMGIASPLIEVDLTKEEIRFLSKEMGLATWDKPAMACLASRIPYGSPIHMKNLRMVEEAEEFLFGIGFRQLRVRHHGNTARIELESPDIPKIIKKGIREKITRKFKELGFTYVTVDLEGYVPGSMNRELGNRP